MSKQKHAFGAFDDLKAGLRFISTILEEEATGLDRSALIDRLNAQGVSQNQVYKTVKALTDLGLIEENQVKRGNVKSVYTSLTPKGRQVAQLAHKIKQALT